MRWVALALLLACTPQSTEDAATLDHSGGGLVAFAIKESVMGRIPNPPAYPKFYGERVTGVPIAPASVTTPTMTVGTIDAGSIGAGSIYSQSGNFTAISAASVDAGTVAIAAASVGRLDAGVITSNGTYETTGAFIRVDDDAVFDGVNIGMSTFPGIWMGVPKGSETFTNYTLLYFPDVAINAPLGRNIYVRDGNSTNYTFNSDGSFTLTQLSSAPSHEEGKFFYLTGVDHALSYYSDVAGTSVQIGQESVVHVINNSGSTIAEGKAVYLTGRDATANLLTIALADADDISTATVAGVVTSPSCTNGAKCVVTSFGRVRDIDTTAFTAGQRLYLSSTAGNLTATKPLPPALVTPVATAGLSNASTGWLHLHVGQPRGESELLANWYTNAVNNVQIYGGTILQSPFQVTHVAMYVSNSSGAGTNNVIRISDGSNNCDATFSCATLGTTGNKGATTTGNCTFAAGASLTIAETVAGCTPDPTVKNIVVRGVKP